MSEHVTTLTMGPTTSHYNNFAVEALSYKISYDRDRYRTSRIVSSQIGSVRTRASVGKNAGGVKRYNIRLQCEIIN